MQWTAHVPTITQPSHAIYSIRNHVSMWVYSEAPWILEILTFQMTLCLKGKSN
jgi:hypothetical protein